MTAKTFAFKLNSQSEAGAVESPSGISPWEVDVLARLCQWFDVEFHLFDGHTGELVHCGFDYRPRDWGTRGQLCRVVAERGKAECIHEEEPLVLLAIPIAGLRRTVVAVGAFVNSHAIAGQKLARLGEFLGLEPADAANWIGRQTCWQTSQLITMGQLASERLALAERNRALEKEAKDLSVHLSKTYEEISLLYRLTQNLKLSSKDEELAALALEWLAEVVPADTLAIQLTVCNRAPQLPGEGRTRPLWLEYGTPAIGSEELTQLIANFELKPGARPLIVNRPVTSAVDWRWPAVRQLIVVSLCEGENCFGWLIAANHSQDEEFGTVEASLLSSVAAILGIHSGNTELYHQQREFFASVVRALTSAIDAKDPYTCGHSDRVARVAVRLAEELGCDRKQLDTIYLSGLLHDVGKIGIDDNVLRKPGKLTEAEYEHIKSHVEIGHKILCGIRQLDDLLPVVLHHHEQWDGGGYPHKLAGEAIPFLARVVAVADSYDAMSSDRPYRKGLSDDRLDAILRAGAGTQWDARVIDAFFKLREEIRHIMDDGKDKAGVEIRELL